ncbi:MAG: sulfatase-like hydrolase/transferase [Planctomycetes bacterium]|nr:sulfatase-like hydrolase/transferase [Planctomycetota bacterium]
MTPTGLLLGALLAAGCALPAAERPPNVVLLLADDLGGADLRCYGHPYARTPNIDALARDGTRFTQCYATGATCCPARTGLMTARFPATYQVYPANGGFAGQPTVTDHLKGAGYATGHFGKWHIGPERRPGTYGIDAIGAGGDADDGKRRHRDDGRGRDAPIIDAAIGFIEQHRDQPFYVNVWGHIAHNPVDPPPALVRRWDGLALADGDFPLPMRGKLAAVRAAGGDAEAGMRHYLAEVEALDDGVGRLLRRLDELGLRESTIVVFSSDQGADMGKAAKGGLRTNQMGSNGPYRGGKHTHWEGGVRVPWIVCWPGHVPAGRCDDRSVLSGADWLPTICTLAGVRVEPAGIDGEDASAAWLGRGEHIRTRPLFWKTSSPGSEALVRDGRWKLRLPTRRRDGEVELYDLDQDPGESVNLAGRHPETVERLSTALSAWVRSLPASYDKTGDTED